MPHTPDLTITQETENNGEMVKALETAMREISSEMKAISAMSDQIATAVEEQSQVAEDMNQQVTTIAGLSQESLEAGQNEALSISHLQGIADQMSELVLRFRRNA